VITPETLRDIAEALRIDPAPAALRRRFPGLHFTACEEDDVPVRAAPMLDAGDHALYLVSALSGHCLVFTCEHEAATGVLVARKAED
jgi:hypothetical protein